MRHSEIIALSLFNKQLRKTRAKFERITEEIKTMHLVQIRGSFRILPRKM